MNKNKLLGLLMVLAPFLVIFVAVASQMGILDTIKAFGMAIGFTIGVIGFFGLILFGVYLFFMEEDEE